MPDHYEFGIQQPADRIVHIEARRRKYLFIMSSHYESAVSLVIEQFVAILGCRGGSFVSFAAVIISAINLENSVPAFYSQFVVPSVS